MPFGSIEKPCRKLAELSVASIFTTAPRHFAKTARTSSRSRGHAWPDRLLAERVQTPPFRNPPAWQPAGRGNRPITLK